MQPCKETFSSNRKKLLEELSRRFPEELKVGDGRPLREGQELVETRLRESMVSPLTTKSSTVSEHFSYFSGVSSSEQFPPQKAAEQVTNVKELKKKFALFKNQSEEISYIMAPRMKPQRKEPVLPHD